MIVENKEYSSLIDKLETLKNEFLNRKLTIGKHKGETFKEIISYDKQYIYWIIRETNLHIDPRILGLKMPTKDDILELLNLTFEDGKFKYCEEIVHPAVYDTWNLGHYGCNSPTCIKDEIVETYIYTYSFDKLLNSERFEIIKNHYPYIKWTTNYLKSLFVLNIN